MRIAAYVPTRGQVWWETAARCSRLWLEAFDRGDELTLEYAQGNAGVVDVRNMIMEAFLASDADVLLMVDDDVVLPDDALEMVTALQGKVGVVGAPCPIMRPGGLVLPNVYAWDEASQSLSIDLHTAQGRGVAEVGAVGFGAVALSREVCRKLKHFKARIDRHRVVVSEDIDFCLRARSQGFQVVVDLEVQCEHMLNVHGNATAVAYGSLMAAMMAEREEVEDGLVEEEPGEEVSASEGDADR